MWEASKKEKSKHKNAEEASAIENESRPGNNNTWTF